MRGLFVKFGLLLLLLAFVLGLVDRLQTSPVIAAVGPGLGSNGQHRKAYYIVGHNPNTLDEALSDLNAGANALEPDMMRFSDSAIDPNGHYINGYQGTSGLFVYHDSVLLTSRVPLTVEAWLDGVHTMAKLQQKNVALLTLDIKSPAATAPLVAALQTAVRTHLNYDGVSVYVIYSVGSFGDAPGLNTIATQLNDHEGVMIDGENDPAQVFNTLYGKGARNIGYGNGSAGECYGLAPNVLTSMDQASWGRAGQPFNYAIPYAFPICSTTRMSEYMKTTDGLIPDLDDLIGGSTGKITDLSGLVTNSPDVYLATSADNPFLQGKEAYGLRVDTFDHLNAGTDSDLTFTLTGACGSASVTLDASYQKRFEQGDRNYVTIPSKDLGSLITLTLSSDGSGVASGWDPQHVQISSDRYGIPYASDKGVDFSGTVDSGEPQAASLTPLNIGNPCNPPTIDSLSKNPTNAGTSINWHAALNGAYNVRIGGTNCTDGTQVASGTYSTAPTITSTAVSAAQLSEGSNTLRVCTADPANKYAFANTVVIKDTIAPVVTIVSVLPAITSKDTTVTWHASDQGPLSPSQFSSLNYSIRIGGTDCSSGTEVASGTYANVTSPPDQNTVITVSTAGQLGSNTVRVCVTDAATNVGSAKSSVTLTPTQCAGMTFDKVVEMTSPIYNSATSNRQLVFGQVSGTSTINLSLAHDSCIVSRGGRTSATVNFGDNVLVGGAEKDVLNGGSGSDKLYGGGAPAGEKDLLNGGAGTDTCVGDAPSTVKISCEN